MKLIYSWILDYLYDKPDFNTLANNLTRIGFSVEDIVSTGADCENVVVAKVLKKEKHPNADRLSLCEVFDGSSNYTVVCGAKNVEAGQTVAFARVGARLGKDILKKAKIRGVESSGMICSKQELGLEEKSDGIMVLNSDYKLGTEVREIFKPDFVFELEITPNLAYCLSHYSVARELSLFYGYKFKDIDFKNFDSGKNNFEIKIETDKCLRYKAVIIKNIENTETPEYIYERLKKIGLNPKGNILIDVSNYVMFELGQPTHCFDLKNIEGGIKVRMAQNGEKIKTLDSNEYELNENTMLIADFQKPLAVAGVIGGYYSSINSQTKDILIEIANFKPQSVRISSKFLNIKTDSSYRFERGVDINLVELAAKRMVEIIKNQNPNSKVEFSGDFKNYKENKKVIKIDAKKINSILGTDIEENKIFEILKKFDSTFDGINFNVPSYRFDMETIWDISEEVARYIGYEVIDSQTTMPISKSNVNPYHILKKEILSKSAVFEFNEVLNYDLVSQKEISSLGFDIKNSVKLSNPLSKEFEYLRPSILPSLLKNLRYNINRGIKSVKIIEFGSVFSKNGDKPAEFKKISGLLCGYINEYEYWKEKEEKIDFFYLKTVISYMLCDFEEIKFEDRKDDDFMANDLSADIYLGDKKIGFLGLLNPDISKMFDIKESEIFYFEIDLDLLVKNFKKDFALSIKRPKPVSQFQYSVRDLSFVLDKKYRYEDVYKLISKFDSDIKDIRLIDVYQGERIESDKKSFTFRFIFSSMEKTFTDEELNKKIENIFNSLNSKLGAKLR
jgi:phenylalanyl-tRNA synthetase beta chain